MARKKRTPSPSTHIRSLRPECVAMHARVVWRFPLSGPLYLNLCLLAGCWDGACRKWNENENEIKIKMKEIEIEEGRSPQWGLGGEYFGLNFPIIIRRGGLLKEKKLCIFFSPIVVVMSFLYLCYATKTTITMVVKPNDFVPTPGLIPSCSDHGARFSRLFFLKTAHPHINPPPSPPSSPPSHPKRDPRLAEPTGGPKGGFNNKKKSLGTSKVVRYARNLSTPPPNW